MVRGHDAPNNRHLVAFSCSIHLSLTSSIECCSVPHSVNIRFHVHGHLACLSFPLPTLPPSTILHPPIQLPSNFTPCLVGAHYMGKHEAHRPPLKCSLLMRVSVSSCPVIRGGGVGGSGANVRIIDYQ